MRSPSASRKAIARTHLKTEQLEDRLAPAVFTTYVNENWHFVTDVDNSGSLSTGDEVRNDNDTINTSGISALYGLNAFGTVTTGTFTGALAAFDNIDDAIANTTTSGIVNVFEGTYGELVTVNNSVNLRGAQAGVDARTRTGVAETVVNGALNGSNRTTAFYITAADVTIDGFTVRDQTDPNVFNAGIVMGPSGVTVRNNIITNNVIGIFANSSGASLIERNLFDGNNQPGPAGGAGIYTESTNGLTIDDNEFRNHTVNNPIIFAAVAAGAHTDLTVSDNFIHDNVSGIFALGITGGVFQGNTITTGGTATALTFGGANTGIDILRNDLSGNLRGLRIADYGYFGTTPNSDIEAHFNSFANNTEYGAGISDEGSGLTDGYTGTLDLTANWWGDVTGPTSTDNPGGSGTTLRNDFADTVDFQPWLLYGDANATQVGFQIPTSFTVNAQTSNFTTTNNNYRRLVNAFEPLQAGQTMILSGNFDWTETNAAASWALGNDGVASAADDYSLLVVPNINDVTVTASSLGAARIQGPGDLATANLEGFLLFDGGDNQNWTISNLEIFDFDLGIGMFGGTGGSDAFNDTTITNNRIRVPADLNATVAPDDVNQNIGIHFSFGTNQTIQNNTIDLAGDGASDGTNLSSMVGMQSNTSGGNIYDGLLIDNNTINVTGTQAASPARVIGIWENAHGHTSNITVSNNDFVNLAAGNDAAANLQRAFRVTSHSSATTTVRYTGNTVDGANIGFEWLAGQNFSGNTPVVVQNNTLTDVQTGFLVQSNGSATFTGTNSVTGTSTGTGLDVRAGSIVSVLGGSFTGTGVGIDVNGGTALIQSVNLNNNSIAGLRLQNGAQVDAGGGGYTGLGTSTGNNDFSSYLPAGPGRAIQNLNVDVATGGFVAAPPDMRAQNNTFASQSPSFIEQVIDHDADVSTQGFVDFGNAQAGNNDAPVASTAALTTNEDAAVDVDLRTLVSDVETADDDLVFSVGGASNGTVILLADGYTARFTPAANYSGPASFTYTVTDTGDPAGNTANATTVGPTTISVTVAPVNDAPVVNNQSFAVSENSSNGTVVGSVATNDIDSPAFTYSITAGNTGGAFAINPATGQITVANSAALDFETNPVFSLTAQVSDGLQSDTATVTITLLNAIEFPPSPVPAETGTPVFLTAVGADAGANSHVKVYNADGSLRFSFFAFPGFNGGVRVATGDVNGDSVDDIVVGAGAGAPGGHVKVFDGATGTEIASFFSFVGYTGGVNVAVGDIDGDGDGDIVVGTAAGAAHVKAFEFATNATIASYFAFSGFNGGVTVAVGNFNGVGGDEIIVGAAGGVGGHVKAFSGVSATEIASFFTLPGVAGGVNVAAGDLDGDNLAEILVGSRSATTSRASVFSGGSGALRGSIAPVSGTAGVRVAIGDTNNDDLLDLLIGTNPGRQPLVQTFNGQTLAALNSFMAFDPTFGGGLFLG